MLRPYHGLAAMAAGLIHHQEEEIIGIALTQFIDKPLQTDGVQIRQIETATGSGVRLDGGIQPQPFIAILDDPRRTIATGAPASSRPAFQAETRLIQGEDAQGAIPHRGDRLAEMRTEVIF